MQYKLLGRTNLMVSSLSIGTAALGMDYGIMAPGVKGPPQEQEALRLLDEATDQGINLFDTAPGYGTAEALLGKALGMKRDCIIATKVEIPVDEDGISLSGKRLKTAVRRSLETSMKALRRDSLDIVQIHNATVEELKRGEMIDTLLEAKQRGDVRFIGASVYKEEEALSAIETGAFDIVQVPYNYLDRKMEKKVFPTAREKGIGIIVRSVFLKGVLTPRARWLPDELRPLKKVAERLAIALGGWEKLPLFAVRFALKADDVSSVLSGIKTIDELRDLLKAEATSFVDLLREPIFENLNDELLSPVNWPLP